MKDLWWPQTKCWNNNMIRSIFIEEDVDWVIELWVIHQGEDELVWILESSGHFSMKIAYHAQNTYYFNKEDAVI